MTRSTPTVALLLGVLAVVSCGGAPPPMLAAAQPAGVSAGPGLTWTLPPGWRPVGPRLTALGEPVHQAAAATFELRQEQPDRGCRPLTALRQLPRDGAIVFLFESRDIAPRDAARQPPRPQSFRLPPASELECLGRGSVVTWREQGRVLSAHVLLERESRRRAEVEALLNSLVVQPVPPPPPPAGWRTAFSGVADSIRVPPGWSARTLRDQRETPRPRTLFRLASPGETVILRVREHPRGPASPAFPAGRRLLRFDARRRAGLSFRGYRVSFRILVRAGATEQDFARAEVAARSAGFSWVGRDPARGRSGARSAPGRSGAGPTGRG